MKPLLLLIVYRITGLMLPQTPVKGQSLKLQGSSSTTIMGDSFVFNCSVTGVDSLQTPLYFKKSPIPICWIHGTDCTNHSFFPDDYTCGCLTGETGVFYADITSVGLEDDGNWTCQYNDSSSNVANLEVLYGPTISIKKNVDVIENTSVTIDCSKHIKPGNPPDIISYEWIGPDEYNETDAVLNRTFTRTEGGEYNCTATNTARLSDTARISINVQYAPTISLSSYFNVTENSSPVLNCSSEMSPGNPSETRFLWSGPEGYNTSGSSLKRNVTRTQGGQYICTAINTAGLSDTAYVNITVQYPPTISLAMNIYDEIEKSTLKIDCSNNITYGNPSDISYQWTGPEEYSKPDAVLDRTVTRTQGGQYTCTATNSAGLSDKAQVYINVQYAPGINIPNNLSIMEDTSPNIDCSSNIMPGNPSNISYEWTGPDGYNNTGAVLERNITRTQGGQYVCTATNTAGLSDTAQVDVDVFYLDPPKMTISPPQVMENRGVQVVCNVTSNPTVKMTIRNGDNTSLVDQEATNSGIYVIHRAQCLQNGTYECLTLNEQASLVETVSASLNVSCSPRHDFRKPLKQTFYRDISETATMVADVIANPLPTFTWLKYVDDQEEPIVNNTVHTVSSIDLQTSLQITVTHVRDYGTYVLKMENGIEVGTLLYTLAPISAPLSPDEVSVINVSSNAVTLQWLSNNNGGSEQTFSVDYRPGEGDWNSWKAEIPDPGVGKAMKTDIIGLVPKTQYMIQVYAQNLYGSSNKVSKDVKTANKEGTSTDHKTEDRLGQGLAIGFGTCVPLIVILSCITVLLYVKRSLKSKECVPTFQAQQTVHMEIKADSNLAERNCSAGSFQAVSYEGLASPPPHAESESYVELQGCKQFQYQDFDPLDDMTPVKDDAGMLHPCPGLHAKSNSYVEMQGCKQFQCQDLDPLDYMTPVKDDTESVYDEVELMDHAV